MMVDTSYACITVSFVFLQESAGLVKDDEIPDNFPEANIAGTSQDMFTQHMEAAVHPDSQINGSGGDVPGNSESKKFQRLPWSDTLKKLFEWRKKNPDRWPGTITKDPEEKILGKWLANQRSYRKTMDAGGNILKGMSLKRVSDLDHAVPGWMGDIKPGRPAPEKRWTSRQSWEQSLFRAKAWRARNPDRWPIQQNKDGDPEEHKVYKWLIEQRRYKKNMMTGKTLKLGGMTPRRANTLDRELTPGWYKGNKDVPRGTFSPIPTRHQESIDIDRVDGIHVDLDPSHLVQEADLFATEDVSPSKRRHLDHIAKDALH
jgi:hypothetical protein